MSDKENDASFFARRSARRAHVGHDTWIGHAAIIKPEVTIGTGAVVASGAIVARDVDPYTIVAGVPARHLRPRFEKSIPERLLALAWWDWSHQDIGDALEDFRSLPLEAFLEKYGG